MPSPAASANDLGAQLTTLIVPVKALQVAKSRMSLPSRIRRGLALAFALDGSVRNFVFLGEGGVTATLTPPPKKLAITHWSTRLLGRHLGVSDATVAKAWRDYGVQPWRTKSFRFSTDPELVAKVVDVAGLYLAPPENAIVRGGDLAGGDLQGGEQGASRRC